MSKSNLIVFAFLALVMGLGYLGSRNARGPVTLAAYSDDIDSPVVFMSTSLLRAGSWVTASVMMHEDHHAMRRLGLIDYDVPTAAALGYVIEWSNGGSLSDSFRIPAFREGLEGSFTDAQKILQRYAGDQESEPLSAYDDGARLAGIALRLCGGTLEGALDYLFSVSMGLSHDDAVELCGHRDAYSIVSKLRHGNYFYLDESHLAQEVSRISFSGEHEKLMAAVMELLDKKYRMAFLRKERLSALGDIDSNIGSWLARRKQAGLELQDRPMALAFQFYEEWGRHGKPVDSDLDASYRLGFNSADEMGEILLKRASTEEPALRRDAAILAGMMNRVFAEDSQAAWRYTQMAAFGLSHVLAIAIARDEEFFYLVCNFRDGRFSVVDQRRLEQDLARLDDTSRAVVLRYIRQLNSEYEVRYVQPALNGRGVIPYDIHGSCVSDAKTACLLDRFRVKVQWASISTSDTDFALVTRASKTSASFNVGGAAVTVTVSLAVGDGEHGVNCSIVGGRSVHAYGIEIVDIKDKRTRAWRAYAGEELVTGSFLLSDT